MPVTSKESWFKSLSLGTSEMVLIFNLAKRFFSFKMGLVYIIYEVNADYIQKN